MHAIIFRLSIIFTLLGTMTWAHAGSLVAVDPVLNGPITQTVPVTGRLVYDQAGPLAARVSGAVERVTANVGDFVERNAPLAMLDTAPLLAERDLRQAQTAQFNAQVAAAKASQTLAKLQLDRLKKLRNSPAFSQAAFDQGTQALDSANAQVASAKAGLRSAKAGLHLATLNLKYTTIRAPYSGVIKTRNISTGAWVTPGMTVFELIDTGSLEWEAELTAARANALKIGDEIIVDLPSGETRALVRAIIPDENPASGTRPVRFVPRGNLPNNLAANQSVTLQLPIGGAKRATTVHKDAIIRQGEQAMVYVVIEGIAQIRPVQLGAGVGNRFIVQSGLKAGESVVIRGNEGLHPGQTVQLK